LRLVLNLFFILNPHRTTGNKPKHSKLLHPFSL
jgi:hypothetical protein